MKNSALQMQTCWESQRDGAWCMCVCGGDGGRGVFGLQLEVVQSHTKGFITGTTELPAAPAR